MTRRVFESDIGPQVRCSKCRELWPADEEFFYMLKGKPHSWCKACYIADRIAKGTSHHTGTGRMRSDHAREQG